MATELKFAVMFQAVEIGIVIAAHQFEQLPMRQLQDGRSVRLR